MSGGIAKITREVLLSVLPIMLVVVILQFSLIKMPTAILARFLAGAVMVTAGLILFLFGMKIGLLPLGEMIGGEITKRASIALILTMAFVLGMAITIAEPDVRVLAHQVDTASGGAISRSVLVLAVAVGVGVFLALALLRVIIGVPIAYLFVAGYGIVLIMSIFAPQAYFPVAFDAGGVTTGPMTVPFLISFGIGTVAVLGGKSSLADGFGLVGLASIGPIISVMVLGMIAG
ncbi:MAG: DUF1538 domain-containing protein [Actinomycetota bacterium]|nr:DUF1538 domain-containing protein [Actinomycetota bacterium]MDD5666213.1 DUF1538 domain-containing protein [Actinomycetota bacterium]